MDASGHPKFLSGDWWYCYGTRVAWFGMFALAAIGIVIWGSFQLARRPNYDLRVTMAVCGKQVGGKPLLDDSPVILELRERLEAVCPDQNGDGTVQIDFQLYTFETTLMSMGEFAQNVGLYSEVNDATTYLFLFDTAMYEKMAKQGHFENLSERYPGRAFDDPEASRFDGTALGGLADDVLPPIDQNAFEYLDDCRALYDDLRIVCRREDGVNPAAESSGFALLDALMEKEP